MITAESILMSLRKVPRNIRYAFSSSVVFGLVAHLYMLTNKLPNYDDLTGLRSYGASDTLGRWFLGILGELREMLLGNYSMPWLNGITYILCIAAVAGITVSLLDIQDRMLCILTGGIMVVFSAVMGTLFFMFTAPFYGIALVLAALSVRLFVSPRLSRNLLGCVLGILSLGIYQAYFPFCAALLVLILIRQLFAEERFTKLLGKSFRYLGLLAVTVAGYLILTRVCLGGRLSSYQGADAMGSLNPAEIPRIIGDIYRSYFTMHTGQFNGVNASVVIVLGLLLLSLCGWAEIAVYAVKQFVRRKREAVCRGLMGILLAVLFPIAVFGIYLMCSHAFIYSLMFYPLVLLFVMPVMLLDQCNRQTQQSQERVSKKGKIVLSAANLVTVAALSLSIVGYCHYDNEYYLQIDLCERQAASVVTTWVTQIKSLDGYRPDMPVAFIGDYQDETYFRADNYFPNTLLAGWTNYVTSDQYQHYMVTYCGFHPEIIHDTGELEALPEVQEMPCYPYDGSIQIIHDTVVLKFS